MKNFLKRNLPVFIIGGGLALIFVVAIVLSQNREQSILPNLIRISEEEDEVVDLPVARPVVEEEEELTPEEVEARVEQIDFGTGQYSNSESLLPGNPVDDAMYEKAQEYLEKTAMTEEEVASTFGTLEIRYTAAGFTPNRPRGYTNQRIRWTNFSERPIEIIQLTPWFESWGQTPTKIAPGGTLEFIMPNEVGIWTYEDKESKDFGAILVERPNRYKPNAELIQMDSERNAVEPLESESEETEEEN